MFFGRNRVEEDLARIRHANLPEKYPPPEDRKARKARIKREKAQSAERIGFQDILAMIIAMGSLVLPYVLVFVGVLGLLLWLWLA